MSSSEERHRSRGQAGQFDTGAVAVHWEMLRSIKDKLLMSANAYKVMQDDICQCQGKFLRASASVVPLQDVIPLRKSDTLIKYMPICQVRRAPFVT